MYETKSKNSGFLDKNSVEIIIPTLNEEASLGKILEDIKSLNLPVTFSTLVIDGGSKDNTVQIGKKFGANVLRQKGKGKGSAMREAVAFSKSKIIVFIDGDGTYDINELGKLLEPVLSDKADMVVGSRLEKREKGAISTVNIIGNKLFNKAINFALKSNVTDSLSGYRVMRKEVFEDLVLFSRSFEIEVEMTVEALAKGYRIFEIPISYKNRIDSQTKLSSTSDGTKIANTLFFVMMNIRPLLFFGIASIIIFGISLYPLSVVIYEKFFVGHLVHVSYVIPAALLMVTSVITFAIGILSELTVRSRRRIEYMIRNK